MPVSEATCPAGISSFFEICNTDSTGTAIADPARIGARGGGFAIARRISARVSARKAAKTRIRIRINSTLSTEARTTEWALRSLLKSAKARLDVRVDIKPNVPIGAGFGTSAAGTLASSMALADAIQLPITLNELGRVTHIAEVVNRTGLGTASPLLIGGFVLVTEPGAPGIGVVDRLQFPKDHAILCAYLESISTRYALSQADISRAVNLPARRVMEAIRRRPDLPTFLTEARRFSEEAGFQTPDIARVMDTIVSAGAVGVAQNMIGKAVHAVAEISRMPSVLRTARKTLPSATLFVTRLDNNGVQLVEARNPKTLKTG